MELKAPTFPLPDPVAPTPLAPAAPPSNASAGREATTLGSLALALAGPFVMGAVLGLPGGPSQVMREGLLLPAVFYGVTALMAPALYIGMSLIGSSPPASYVANAMARGFRACGLVLAGLAPAAAFLLATADGDWAVWVFGTAAVAAAALLGVRRLFQELRHEEVRLGRALALYTVWSLVSLGLGAHFFLQTLRV